MSVDSERRRCVAAAEIDRVHVVFQLVEVDVHQLAAIGTERPPVAPGQALVAERLLIRGVGRQLFLPVDSGARPHVFGQLTLVEMLVMGRRKERSDLRNALEQAIDLGRVPVKGAVPRQLLFTR